jgi:hypothetical protein
MRYFSATHSVLNQTKD